MKKISIIVLIVILLTGGCVGRMTNNPERAEGEAQFTPDYDRTWTFDKESFKGDEALFRYSFKTSRVSVYCDVNNGLQEPKIIGVTDAGAIEKLAGYLDTASWEKATPDKQYKGMCYYYLDFHNGTVVGLYQNVSYGTIGDRIETRDFKGNKFLAITNSQVDYYMPESALAYVKQLTENAGKRKNCILE